MQDVEVKRRRGRPPGVAEKAAGKTERVALRIYAPDLNVYQGLLRRLRHESGETAGDAELFHRLLCVYRSVLTRAEDFPPRVVQVARSSRIHEGSVVWQKTVWEADMDQFLSLQGRVRGSKRGELSSAVLMQRLVRVYVAASAARTRGELGSDRFLEMLS